ncbi:MAG: hypothetical protein JOZ24_04490, partial [Candidatus Eremiobacteraeota bacterium]|nr:hypothetical protein [Candidatus Eremiobacteraeota bacterium]
ERRSVPYGTLRNPVVAQIPPIPVHDPGAPPHGGFPPPGFPPGAPLPPFPPDVAILPPEEFPFAGFRPGTHDWVRVVTDGAARLTVTLPATTALLRTAVGSGTTSIEGFRGANLFAVQTGGRLSVTGASTTAFLQMVHGTLYSADTSFNRVRVRAIAAHVVFERVRSKQIEASSVSGAIVYDGGWFDPGLARFESASGNIALGILSPAQITGRTQDGHVYAMVDRRAGTVDQHADNDFTATIGSGGTLVSAVSARGNVYVYDGSLLGRRMTTPEWRAVHQLLRAQHPGQSFVPALKRPKQPRPPRAQPASRFRAGTSAAEPRRV